MDELKLGPHSERHSSHNVIREQGASEFFTFTEIKPGLAVIKLEPKGETELEPEPDGTLDPGPDGEIDPLALNTERAHPVVEQEDLPCPLAFLALESKAEDGMWDSAAATVKVEIDGETREVHLEECNGVGKVTWNWCMELKRKRGRTKKHVNVSEEEKLAKKREKNRLCKRQYQASKSQEAIAKEREQNSLYMRQIRASLTDEEVDRRRERDRTHKQVSFVPIIPELCKADDIKNWHSRSRKHKRKPVIVLTPRQLEGQRERNRIYMRRFRASLSVDKLVKCHEKERLLKRRARKIMKQQKLDHTFQDGFDAVHTVLQSMGFWHYATFIKERNLLQPKNLHTCHGCKCH